MDEKQLTGISLFKFLFLEFVQRAVVNIMSQARSFISNSIPQEIKFFPTTAFEKDSIYTQSRESTVVIQSQIWKRNFLVTDASFWGLHVSPLMGPTVDGFIGFEGKNEFQSIPMDLSIREDSSDEESEREEEHKFVEEHEHSPNSSEDEETVTNSTEI